MDTTNRWRFDAGTHRWVGKVPPQVAGPFFCKTVLFLFLIGCVLQFFR